VLLAVVCVVIVCLWVVFESFCVVGFHGEVRVWVGGMVLHFVWFCAGMFVLGWCLFVCSEGVCFAGVRVVCVFVWRRLMVWCALCWEIVLPGCFLSLLSDSMFGLCVGGMTVIVWLLFTLLTQRCCVFVSMCAGLLDESGSVVLWG